MNIQAIMALLGTFMELGSAAGEGQAEQLQALHNRDLANSAAADAVARGNREAAVARMQASSLLARQRMAYVAGGVDPTVGTPAQVASDTRALAELDARQLENNAAREAWGFRAHGMQYGQQAQLSAMRTTNRMVSTILGGVGRQVAGWRNYGPTGGSSRPDEEEGWANPFPNRADPWSLA